MDNWLVVPNLWGAIIGRPSLLKSPAISEMLKPLELLIQNEIVQYKQEMQSFESEKMIAEAEKGALKEQLRQAAKKNQPLEQIIKKNQMNGLISEPRQRRYKTEDATVEKIGEILLQNPNGILVHRDELMGWLSSLDRYGREGDRAFYLESWNGTGSFTIDRISRGTLHIPALCLSILGGIQPGPISSYVYQATAGGTGDDGLLQRFQVTVWPDTPKHWKNIDRWPDTEAKKIAYQIFKKFDELQAIHDNQESEIPALRFSPEGQEIFNDWRCSLEIRLRSGGLPLSLESHLAKYRSLMPSLALIFHLVNCETKSWPFPPIDENAALMAIEWCKYLETHARRLYSSAMDPSMESARALLQKIKSGDVQDCSSQEMFIVRNGLI